MKNIKNTFIFFGTLSAISITIPTIFAMDSQVPNGVTQYQSPASSPKHSPKGSPQRPIGKENQETEVQTFSDASLQLPTPDLTAHEEVAEFLHIKKTPEIETSIKQLFPWKKESDGIYSFKIPKDFNPLHISLFTDSFQNLLRNIGKDIQDGSQGILLMYEIEYIINTIKKQWELIEANDTTSNFINLNFPICLIQLCLAEKKLNLTLPIIIFTQEWNFFTEETTPQDLSFEDLSLEESSAQKTIISYEQEYSKRLEKIKNRNNKQVKVIRKSNPLADFISLFLEQILAIQSINQVSFKEKIEHYFLPAFFIKHKLNKQDRKIFVNCLKFFATILHSESLSRISYEETEIDDPHKNLTIIFLNHSSSLPRSESDKLRFLCNPNFAHLKTLDYSIFHNTLNLFFNSKGIIENYKFDEIAHTNELGWTTYCNTLESYTHVQNITLKNCNIGYLFKEKFNVVTQFCKAISKWKNLTHLNLRNNRLFLALKVNGRSHEPLHLIRGRSFEDNYEFEDEKLLKLFCKSIAQLENLTHLELRNNELDKVAISPQFFNFLETLALLPNLTIVDLRNNELNHSDIERLQTLKPLLRILT